MHSTDKPRFLEVLSGVHDFYGKELSSFAAAVWWQACGGFELERATKALSAHLMDPDRGQFMPKPADIVRQLRGTQADRSLIAWGKVLDAMQRVGAYNSVVFDDGAIHAAIIDIGGWMDLCRSNTDDLPFLQKRFCDSHRVYSARPDHPYPARLIGEYEAINRLNGRTVAPPTLVGDAERSLRVMELGAAGSKTTITVADAMPDVRRIGNAA